MSATDPIARDSDLGRLLDSDRVPRLPEGFADRIVARTNTRAAPLPETRNRRAPKARWRSVRRLGIAALGAGALATAAAATGALETWGISLPRADQVWASLTGKPSQAEEERSLSLGPSAADDNPIPAFAPQIRRASMLDGSIDTPEELEEAFARFERARQGMKETRRRNVDRRIERIIERRQARGFPAPTPAQEERIRNRIERSRERRDARSDARIKERREALLEKLENGEEITEEDLRPRGAGRGSGGANRPLMRERIERLRELPPEERRERLEQWRERRQERRNRRTADQAPSAEEPATEAPAAPEVSEDAPPPQ